MENSRNKKESGRRPGDHANGPRPDLQDGSKGRDLSYLNEMPQMGGYEGVKGGSPPPRGPQSSGRRKSMADES